MSLSEKLKKTGIGGRLLALMLISGLFLILLVYAVMLPFFRWNLTSILEGQQTTLLTTIQTEIDAKLALAKTQLAAVAGVLPPEAMHNQYLARRFLQNRMGIAQIFDNGLVLLNTDGKLLAETPAQPDRTIFDFSGYSFFQQALAAQTPCISAPFLSSKPPCHPVVQFSAPVRDRSGRLTGFLSGGIRLDGNNVIGSIARHKVGKSGYLFLYAQDRTMLAHPDPARILQQDVAPGANRLFDKAINGWEGTGRTVNSRGLHAVSSFRHIREAPWILASNIPETEAFYPARRAGLALGAIIGSAGLLTLFFSWITLRSITRPLDQFSRHLEQLGQKQGDDRLFYPEAPAPQELHLLAGNFNRMQQELDLQQRELAHTMSYLHEQAVALEQEIGVRQHTEQELTVILGRLQATACLLQTVCDNVPDLIWAKDLQGNYLFTNLANARILLGVDSTTEPIGKNHLEFLPKLRGERPDRPDWYTFGETCVDSDRIVLSAMSPQRFNEFGNVRGEYLHLDVYKSPFYDEHGTLIGTVGSARIVTRENLLEQENARLSRLYRILSEINQKISHRPEPTELLQFVCDTLIADKSFLTAWIGLPDGSGGYFPAVAAGMPVEVLAELGSVPPPAAPLEIFSDFDAIHADGRLCPVCGVVRQTTSCNAVAVCLIRPTHALPVLLHLYAGDARLVTHEAEQRLLDELVADLAFALDAMEQERTGYLNRQQLELAATVFENSAEGIAITDGYERIISVNRAFCEITGYQPEEVIGQTHRLLKSGRHDRAFYQAMRHALQETDRWQGEVWNRRKDGQVYPELLSISAVRDEQGRIHRYIAVFSDISGIKQSQQQIEYLEWSDPLTDLPNRRMLCSHLAQAVDRARRRNAAIALLYLDLDHFKDINDSFGHLTGDALLRLAAQRLRKRMRASDMVARLGGDEFIVLLEEPEQTEHIPVLADEIIALLQQPFMMDTGIELQTSVSIGIALFPEHGQNAMELLQQADAALYQAKQQGRSRFAYFSDEMTEKAVERINLGNYLRRAVEKDELLVYYQPQVDSSTGRIVGGEALMRWQNPVLGMVLPVRFIPLAEEIGCIVPMGEWILRQVCLQGRQWLDEGLPPITLAVNLSPAQIRHQELPEMVQRTLETTGFPAEFLELELTESALMQHEEETITLLKRLKQLGVSLALDDFGTGYSSLAYLKHFPLDLLKIDKSFVDDLPHGRKDSKIVMTIVQMGRSLGFKLLAEGVEREEQSEALRSLGCTCCQGYLYSKPLPAEEFARLLAGQAAADVGTLPNRVLS